MKDRRTIVILGAGIAGLRCALDLADRIGKRHDYTIMLIDKTPCHTLHSSLYETVTAVDLRGILCLPIKELVGNRRIHFLVDQVKEVDPIHQKVSLDSSGTIRYDYLVLALGNTPNIGKIRGLAEHSTILNSFQDALSLRATIKQLIIKKKKLKVLIGGAGAVGCELAGSLAYFSKELQTRRASRDAQLEINLIEQSGRVLPGEAVHVAATMAKKLRELGVGLYFGKAIERVSSGQVTLGNKSKIPYDLLVWTGGSHGSHLLGDIGFETDPHGRIVVTPSLQARGFSRVYVIGDAAHFSVTSRQTLSPSIVYATSQGAKAAKNIMHQIDDQPIESYVPPFNPRAFNFGNYAALLPIKSWMIYGSFGLLLKKFLVFDYLLNIMPLHRILISRSRRGAILALSRLMK